MLNSKKYLLKKILNEHTKLNNDLKNEAISVADYLKTYGTLATRLQEIGDLSGSIETLARKLNDHKVYGIMPIPQETIQSMTEHEREHEMKASEYDISSKFIFIHYGRQLYTVTWCFDLLSKAKNWDIKKLKEFDYYVSQVSRLSTYDKRE